MTRSGFTVETRGQGAVIIGGGRELVSKLIEEFLLLGVQAVSGDNLSSVEELSLTHDLDYILAFDLPGSREISEDLKSRLESGESRLVLARHSSSSFNNFLDFPVHKYLVFSDYVGVGELVSPTISSWLNGLGSSHTLSIPGDGLEEISLLGVGDLTHLISLSTISPGSRAGEVVELGNPEPISLLNLAYLIRTSLNFKVAIKFDEDKEGDSLIFDPDTYSATLTKLNYHLADSAENNLKNYLSSYKIVPAKEDPPQSKTPEITKPVIKQAPVQAPEPKKLTPLKVREPVFVPLEKRKLGLNINLKPRTPRRGFKMPRPSTVVGRGLIIAISLYFGTLAFALTISGLSLRRVVAAVSSGQLPTTSGLNDFATTYLHAHWRAFTSIPGVAKNQKIADLSLLFDSYTQSISIIKTAKQLSMTSEDLIHYVFGSGSGDAASLLSLGRLQAEDLYQQLSLLDGSLPADPPQILRVNYSEKYLNAKAKISTLKHTVLTSKALLATVPDLIGLGGRRKYGVLFQNNMELRSTGGFIGSFAILSFENGKLYDMPIFDVYDADGQLKGHVEPPKPIKDILGEANWYLRDSNFDPDFPTSARRAEWFIKKSLNQDLDGTIGVNVSTLEALLEAVGPLEVADYNETITSENLYERAQFHAEVNFFPGSTQKKEFLSTVANALFSRLPNLAVGEGLKLADSLTRSIEEKNTLISLTSDTSDHVFSTLGWNGQLNDFPCPAPSNCHKDYAMVVDNNFGVNKANYFIRRNIEEIITFDKNLGVSHSMRLHYQNTSTSTAWPSGAYKNYQRIYLPVGSNLTSITVGDKTLTSSEYEISSEHDKLIIAYMVNVGINSKLDVEIDYASPQLGAENEFLYTWYWQKQPGTSADDNLLVYLNYPLYLKPVVVSPEAGVATQQLKFDFKNDTDHRLTVKFSK